MLLNWIRKHTRLKYIDFRTARRVNRFYTEGCILLDKEIQKNLKTISHKIHPLKNIFVQFSCERISHGCGQAIFLHKKHPASSHTSIACIVRGIFESAVNCLYVLDDVSNRRLAAFWLLSIKEEHRINNEMKKWLCHANAEIVEAATTQFEPNMPTEKRMGHYMLSSLGILHKDVPRWPSIFSRSKEVGDLWQFFYDIRYRGLSTWQHGDISRIIVSPSFLQLDPAQQDRNFFEAIGMVSWSFETLYQFSRAIAQQAGNKDSECQIQAIHLSIVQDVSPLLKHHIERLQAKIPAETEEATTESSD